MLKQLKNCSLYLDPDLKDVFFQQGLADFDAWWSIDVPFIDELNHRGTGWSGVSFLKLEKKGGKAVSMYIKRQEDYKKRTLFHPLSGIPTFKKEFQNIQILFKLSVPTITPLYFAERYVKGKYQSILVTKALSNYVSLDSGIDHLNPRMQKQLMARCGAVTRKLNDNNYFHNSLYPKHLFYSIEGSIVDVCLIDLEKLIWRPWKKTAMYKEIERFIRRRGTLSDTNMQIFLDSYLSSGSGDLSNCSFAHKLYALI